MCVNMIVNFKNILLCFYLIYMCWCYVLIRIIILLRIVNKWNIVNGFDEINDIFIIVGVFYNRYVGDI